jgi:hypothetical protein
MRPDLDDVLAGLQRLLLNNLLPALATSAPFLAEQAMYANLLLDYCRKSWPRLHLALAEEHGDLCATLAAAAGALRPEAAARDLVAAVDGELAQGAADVTRTALDALAARNRTLRDLVARTVALLDAQAELPSGSAWAAARAAVDAYLVRAAGRQYADLQQLGLIW